MKQGAILSDVGSVKGDVIKKVTPFLTDKIHFVPGHPIAGTEYSGPEAGFAERARSGFCRTLPRALVCPHARWMRLTPPPQILYKNSGKGLAHWSP